MHGQFLWCDVMTTDPAAAEAFYTEVVGWGSMDGGAPDMDYTVLTVDGQGLAGIMPIPPGMDGPPHPVWFTYVVVDDVDEAVARIQAAGGALHRPPHTVPGVIRFAVVADPQGAVFLVAKGLSSAAMPRFATGTPGTVGWHELYTSDPDAGFDFYAAMFGWTKNEAHDMGPMGPYQLFTTPGSSEPSGGMMKQPPQVPVPHWGLYFNVDAVGAAVERVKAGGGQVLVGPHQVPGGDWTVRCIDPQGAVFALTSMKA